LRESIIYAKAHQDKAIEYALKYGRGLDMALGKRFVDMYVNEDTLTQGREVQEGLKNFTSSLIAGTSYPKTLF